jgi:hypothetical protein
MFDKILEDKETIIKFIRDNQIVSIEEWNLYISCSANDVQYYNHQFQPLEPLPKNIPHNLRYKNIYFSNIIKNTKVRKVKNVNNFMTYDNLKNHLPKFTNYQEWLTYLMNFRKNGKIIPSFIPINTEEYYKKIDEWFSWSDFLNIKAKDVNKKDYDSFERFYVSYDDARLFARSLNLYGVEEWFDYVAHPKSFININNERCKDKPKTIPPFVHRYYMATNEWISWDDFLGCDSRIKYTLNELSIIAQQNKISGLIQWHDFARLHKYPIFLPYVYHYEWNSWYHFLNKPIIEYLSLSDIQKFLINKNFKTIEEYKKWWDTFKPNNLPKFIDIYLNKHTEDYSVSKYFGLSISEKLINEDYRPVFYISRYCNGVDNLISISVDNKGKPDALMVIQKKNQILLKMYVLDSLDDMKRIVNAYCMKYSNGESNQYLVMNYPDMIRSFSDIFEEL